MGSHPWTAGALLLIGGAACGPDVVPEPAPPPERMTRRIVSTGPRVVAPDRCLSEVVATPVPPADAPSACFWLEPMVADRCVGTVPSSEADAMAALRALDAYHGSWGGFSVSSAYLAFVRLHRSPEAARWFRELVATGPGPVRIYGLCGLAVVAPDEGRAAAEAARGEPDVSVLAYQTDMGIPLPQSELLRPLPAAEAASARRRWHWYEAQSLEHAALRATELGEAELARDLYARWDSVAAELVAEALALLPTLPAGDPGRGTAIGIVAPIWFRLAFRMRDPGCDDAGALRTYLALLDAPRLDAGDASAERIAAILEDATVNAALLAEHRGEWELAERLFGAIGAEADDPAVRIEARYRAALMRYRRSPREGAAALSAFLADPESGEDVERTALARWYLARALHGARRRAARDAALRAFLEAHERLEEARQAALAETAAAARALLEGGAMPEAAPDPSASALQPPPGCN